MFTAGIGAVGRGLNGGWLIAATATAITLKIVRTRKAKRHMDTQDSGHACAQL